MASSLIAFRDIPTISALYRAKRLTPSSEEANDLPTPSQAFNNKICTVKADLTKLQVDAIVNAANSSLLGGGGVDGAIHRAAGPDLVRECRTLNGCKTGSAKITDAYDLPCKKVIHAVGPVYDGDEESEPFLRGCYRTSLKLAADNECKSIAFSAISTGVYGYPSESAAEAAIDETRLFLESSDGKKLDKVVFCNFLDKDVNAYSQTLPLAFPPTKEDLSEGEYHLEDPLPDDKLPTSDQTRARATSEPNSDVEKPASSAETPPAMTKTIKGYHPFVLDGAVPNVSKKRKLISDQDRDDAASIIDPQQQDRRINSLQKFYRRRFPQSADDASEGAAASQGSHNEADGIDNDSQATVINVNGVKLCAAEKEKPDNTTDHTEFLRHDPNYLPGEVPISDLSLAKMRASMGVGSRPSTVAEICKRYGDCRNRSTDLAPHELLSIVSGVEVDRDMRPLDKSFGEPLHIMREPGVSGDYIQAPDRAMSPVQFSSRSKCPKHVFKAVDNKVTHGLWPAGQYMCDCGQIQGALYAFEGASLYTTNGIGKGRSLEDVLAS